MVSSRTSAIRSSNCIFVCSRPHALICIAIGQRCQRYIHSGCLHFVNKSSGTLISQKFKIRVVICECMVFPCSIFATLRYFSAGLDAAGLLRSRPITSVKNPSVAVPTWDRRKCSPEALVGPQTVAMPLRLAEELLRLASRLATAYG